MFDTAALRRCRAAFVSPDNPALHGGRGQVRRMTLAQGDEHRLTVKPTSEPTHIFFRFTGVSKHDAPGDATTPTVCGLSFVSALEALPHAQARATAVTILLNGPAAPANASAHGAWFRRSLGTLPLRALQVRDSPSGNWPSFVEQRRLALALPEPRTVVLFLEEDFALVPLALQRLAELFYTYDPCMAALHDNPNLYRRVNRLPRRTSETWHRGNAVLKAPQLHWRSVYSVTVTYAARVEVMRSLDAVGCLPTQRNDTEASLAFSGHLGIFAPLTALASHVHMDFSAPGDARRAAAPNLPTFSLDFSYRDLASKMLRRAEREGFPVPRGFSRRTALSYKRASGWL